MSKKKKIKRIQIEIEEDLWAKLKSSLALKKMTIRAWVARMARKEVGDE